MAATPSSPASPMIFALAVLLVLKVALCLMLFGALEGSVAERGLGGLALTSVAATVMTAFAYALASTSLAGITDALAAALAALAAVVWAGLVVSGAVRRLV